MPAAGSVDTDTASAVTILGYDRTELLKELDSVFAGWGLEAGAREICPPPVFPVRDLAKFDVYRNFPHLALVAGPLDTEQATGAPAGGTFATGTLKGAGYGLPHATCYAAYLFHEGTQLPSDTLVTLVNRCFRNETRYSGLRRLLSFQMREIVALGEYDHTQRVLGEFTERILAFADTLGLKLEKHAASDPFFEEGGAWALLQKLSPVKYEFQHDGLAIASVNTHKNFFGERCGITLPESGDHAFTSCTAFGLERWVSVLEEVHGGDIQDAIGNVRAAAAEVA